MWTEFIKYNRFIVTPRQARRARMQSSIWSFAVTSRITIFSYLESSNTPNPTQLSQAYVKFGPVTVWLGLVGWKCLFIVKM